MSVLCGKCTMKTVTLHDIDMIISIRHDIKWYSEYANTVLDLLTSGL